MTTTHTIVTAAGAAMVAFSAISVFTHAKWVVEPLADYSLGRLSGVDGVRLSWTTATTMPVLRIGLRGPSGA